MTQKTGNFKKFSVFVKMLCTSLMRDQRSETVFADLLTYSDLEMLRSRQTRKPVNTAARPNNKRYLILTYAVEFDRVHYPLPLAHVDEPPVHALNAAIRRLREEIKQLQASGHSRALAADSGADDRDAHDLRRSHAKILKEKDQALKELDKMRTEVARLNRTNDQLAADLERQQGNSFEHETHSRQLKEARRRVTELENELANEQEEARAEQEELRRQLVILQRELDAGKQTILDLKGRVREVSQNSDVAVRRAKLEADSRLDHKRAIYGSSPNSRPSSAERRRTSPSPTRPFQRFDPTAYVKEKQQTQRARSSSPRPGVPPSSAAGAGSRGRSRPSSAERQRPPSSGAGSAANSRASSRPSSVERPRRPRLRILSVICSLFLSLSPRSLFGVLVQVCARARALRVHPRPMASECQCLCTAVSEHAVVESCVAVPCLAHFPRHFVYSGRGPCVCMTLGESAPGPVVELYPDLTQMARLL